VAHRVSYIIYLTDPDEPWTEQDGGSLELYPLEEGGVGGCCCRALPSTFQGQQVRASGWGGAWGCTR